MAKTPQYRIETFKAVRDSIIHLPPRLKRRVRAAFRAIADNPYQAKPLKDELSGLRSYRVGRTRLILRITNSVVEIVAFGSRSDIYKRAAAELSASLQDRGSDSESKE